MPCDPICGMDVKESSAWQLSSMQGSYYFCSEYCLKKFQQAQPGLQADKTLQIVSGKKPWWTNQVVILLALLGLVLLFSFVFPILVPFRRSIVMYFQNIWWALLLGLFIGGVVDHFVPREYFIQILSRPKKRTIFYSVVLGSLMSVCSHGILAIAIELYKKGASTSAVIAFLLASPWANFSITLLLISFFGVVKALYIICSAILIALTTGVVFQILEKWEWVEKNPNGKSWDPDFSVIDDIRRRKKTYRVSRQQFFIDLKGIYHGSVALSNMVLLWIIIGVVLASLSGAYIPQDLFRKYMGPSTLGLLVTLGVATILEVCSEGMAPLAFEIFKQTGALGNSFVFLMAGVATDYTEIGLLWQNIGKKTAVWMPVVAVPQIVLYGILANYIF